MATIQSSLYGLLENLGDRVRGYIPFTRLYMASLFMNKNSRTVLDVGCGGGKPGKFLKSRRNFFMVGVDIWLPSLQQARQLRSHDAYVLADIRFLPFHSKSFDAVLGLEVIEHLKKKESSEFIKNMKEIARKQVIITTPVGKLEQGVYSGNPYQAHKSSWIPMEMRKQGYKVRGYKLRGMFRDGLLTYFTKIIGLLLTYAIKIVQIVPSPLTYFIPELAGNMICVKELESGCPEK